MKKIGILAVVVALAIVAWGLFSRWHHGHQLDQWTQAQAVPMVTVITPTPAAKTSGLTLPGSLQAYNSAPIFARTNGYVRRWLVDIGDDVRAGQLLAVLDAPEVEPPPHVFDRIKERIAATTPAPGPAGSRTVRAAEGKWEFVYPGIERKLLWHDRERKRVTFLIRAQPGAEFPSHEHDADEDAYVLSGDLAFDDLALGAGDYHLARRAIGLLEERGFTRGLAEDECRVVRSAALLHDIGHYPYSHALEEIGALHHEEVARPLIEELGVRVEAPQPSRWYLSSDAFGTLAGASPLRASGRNIEIWLPHEAGTQRTSRCRIFFAAC